MKYPKRKVFCSCSKIYQLGEGPVGGKPMSVHSVTIDSYERSILLDTFKYPPQLISVILQHVLWL